MSMATTTSESVLSFMRPRSRGGRAAAPREPRRPLSQELFKAVLIKERKRADRSNQPWALLIISVDDPTAPSSFIWKPIIESLSAVTRETDLMGWFARRTVISVVLTEVQRFEPAAARALEVRISQQLGKHLDAETIGKVSIRVRVPPRENASEDGEWPVDQPKTAYDAAKRGLDVLGSLTLLLLLSPVFLVISAVVKAGSRGPVFFGQMRVGQMMKPFRMQKFRTMRVDADPALHREYVASFIHSTAQPQLAGGNAVFKLTNDPRVTRVGRVLRKTSLDELPQLWNVLRGEMSLVGPRPPIPYELEQYKPWHCRRILEAKPGITGLWQVAGRSRTTFDEMVRLDLRYARTCSLWNDLKILAATPAAVFSGKGAC